MGKYPAFLKMRVAQEDLEIIEEKAAVEKTSMAKILMKKSIIRNI